MLYEQGLLIPCFPAQNTRIINVFPVEEFLMQEDVCSLDDRENPFGVSGITQFHVEPPNLPGHTERPLASPWAPSRKVLEISLSKESSVVDSECMKHIWKINYLLINPSPFLPYLMASPYPWNAIFVVYDWLDEARKENKLGWLQNREKNPTNPPKPAKRIDL